MMKLKTRCQARTRHELSVVAVIQMLNLYRRQLKNAQSLLETDAPWSDAITCSAQQDMVPGTLFLKSRFTPTGIERRIVNSKPTVKNVDKTFEETQGFQDYQRSEEQVPRDNEKRRGRSERYNTRGLDDSESEDDFSAYAKPATRQKNVSAMGWLRNTFSSSKKSDKQKPKLKLKVSNSDVSEECAEHSKEEISTEADELVQKEGQAMKTKENAPKNREAGILSGVKTGLSKVLTKIGSEKKSKRKESASINIEDSDTEEKAKWGNKAKNKQADIPFIPRKRQKKDEKNFSCPLCNCKFSEEEINEHAFTCNGEPPRATRNNFEVSDQSEDFIPLEMGSSLFKGQQSISAKATQKDDYAEWQKACKKVDMGKVKPVQMDQLVNEKTEISLEASYKEMCKDSEKICRDIISENEKKRTTATKEKEVKELDKDSKAWMSSDSDSQDANKTTDFLHQYLEPEQIVNKPKKKPVGMNGARKRPRAAILDQEDSMGNGDNMEKCFICSKIFPTGKVYNKHVNECLSREEGEDPCNNEETHNFANGAQPSQDQHGLHKRLGNRKSWAPFEKKVIYDEEDDLVENPDSDEFNQDSPIKSFKPVGESSLFNFGNQFKNRNPNQKGSKLSTKLPRRRKRRKDN